MHDQDKPTILILCTGNSCRSHMAEGVLKSLLKEHFNVQSAGANPSGKVNPLAIEVMGEIGIDISAHSSKHLNTFLNDRVSTVISVCCNASHSCPTFPGQMQRYHCDRS